MVSDTANREIRKEKQRKRGSRSEMSIRSKIFDRRFDGISAAGVGCFSGKDVRGSVGSGWDGDFDIAHDGFAAEAVSRSKVWRLDAGSGSPVPVRVREVGDSTGVTAGE